MLGVLIQNGCVIPSFFLEKCKQKQSIQRKSFRMKLRHSNERDSI